MGQPFIGEIKAVAFDYAPRNWATCSGQLLAVSQNEALFSLLGDAYGGDGRNSFGLPNLNGRCIVHKGHGIGLSNRIQGEVGGQETVTLTTQELASHSHALHASDDASENVTSPQYATFSTTSRENIYKKDADPTVAMSSDVISYNGGNYAHNNMMPYLVINYIIALAGDYPSRS